MPAAACRRQTAKKYRSRPSPPFPAQNCRGTRKRGNDGRTYVSTPDARGVYRWTAAETKGTANKVYETHDNGGRPFAVEDSGDRVVVYRQKYDESTDSYQRDHQVFASKYQKIWLGTKPAGNTVLFQVTAGRYVFIGDRIYEFSLVAGDSVVRYVSPVGNSDVPYPYVIGKTHTYLLLDGGGSIGPVFIPNEALDPKTDAYAQFYGWRPAAPGFDVKKVAKPIRRRQIAKRIL